MKFYIEQLYQFKQKYYSKLSEGKRILTTDKEKPSEADWQCFREFSKRTNKLAPLENLLFNVFRNLWNSFDLIVPYPMNLNSYQQ